jgi:hypothetical protein
MDRYPDCPGGKEQGADCGGDLQQPGLGNYNNCTVRGQVKNPEGQVLLTYKAPPISRPDQFSVAFGSGASELELQPLKNGSNTIHVYARLSNGELLEAYKSVLK